MATTTVFGSWRLRGRHVVPCLSPFLPAALFPRRWSLFAASASTSSATPQGGGLALELETVDFGPLAGKADESGPEWQAAVDQVRRIFQRSGESGLACFHARLGSTSSAATSSSGDGGDRGGGIVPARAIARGYKHLKAFHSLDEAAKAKYHSGLSPINRGWVPLFEEPAYVHRLLSKLPLPHILSEK